MTEQNKMMAEEVKRRRELGERMRIEAVGRRIKLARVSNNLTQKLFADKIGISRNYLSVLESGKGNPSLDVMMSLQEYVPDIMDLLPLRFPSAEHEAILSASSTEFAGHSLDAYAFQENFYVYMMGLIKRLNEDERREVEEFIFALFKKRKE